MLPAFGEFTGAHPVVRAPGDRVVAIAGEALRLLPGEVWFVDVSRPHSVANHGETPRVHLVLDCVVNEWVNTLLTSEAHAEPTPSI